MMMKGSLKRGFGLLRGRGNQRALESVAKASGGGGVVTCRREEDGVVMRMKIVVKKSDLKQLIQALGSAGHPSPVTAERRLKALMRRKHIHHTCWTPALQSIPE